MKYAKYIKEAVFIVVVITLSVRIVDNVRTIRQMKISLEQTRDNLYQTNQVIAEMQKQIYEPTFAFKQDTRLKKKILHFLQKSSFAMI